MNDAALAAAVAAHRARYTWLDDPEKVRDQCYYVARAFGRTLGEHGVSSYLVSGWIVDDDGNVIAMHYATVIGDEVWDWTFRQFEPDAPVPMITPLTGWEEAMFDVESYGVDEEPPGLDESLNDIYRKLAARGDWRDQVIEGRTNGCSVSTVARPLIFPFLRPEAMPGA